MTRAEYYSIKPKALAAQSKRRIAAIRNRIHPLVAPWEDVTTIANNLADDLLAALDAFEEFSTKEGIEYLNEEMPE